MNYKTYLAGAKNSQEFRYRFNHLARNARGWMDLGFEIRDLPELVDTNLEEAYKMAISMLRSYYSKQASGPTLEEREDTTWIKKRLKKSYLRKAQKKDFYEDFVVCEELQSVEEGDKVIPIIHGGDLGRIVAAMHHGRGYGTDNYMGNPRTKMTENTGLMFHSSYSGRAHYYARCSASQRMGIPAILVAKVKRKYLFQNQGDEYSLPTWHYDKILSYEIISEDNERYWEIEEYYLCNYKKQPALV